ncbi:restriction endonuclease subunit S [Vibrio parahaemolyticus]|uniref:restriction endonuclease subunit S n=1 Tax=Vibrio parahaemolyticus TaxID=670 RepID=UPI0011215E64|nr:restriction endonuclease subunit S [Vibrio parahaemolyticus]MDX8422869.1 hypothetical protein [Vibrio parahaemolyticus]TOB56576.1 hypothetical protein CGK03_20500 [Vibrio parahaemolyticus]
MGKYQAYPEYKDSGVEWLGEIPSFWRCTRLKRYCKVTDGSHHSPKIEADGYPFISVTDVGLNSINFSDAKRISQKDYRRLVKEGCKPSIGDVLLTKDGTIGRACIVKEDMPDFVILSSLGLLTPKEDIVNSYLYYYLVSGINVDQMNSMIHGSALRRMTISKIDDLILVLPSRDEQTKIANFLDHETAKIDTLLEKQQQLIKLLKEKRQAVISHAVTKGLNPEVLMKDSGVEWLGEVPEHWQVCRLKHIATIQSGIAKGGKDLTGKTLISVPMLRVANVQDGYLKLEDVHSIQIEPHMLERYSLKNGDVLMNEGGDNDKLGRGAIWREQIQNCIHQNHVFVIRTQGIEPEWLDTLTRASYAKFYFFSVAKQSTNLASISATNIKETPILVPSDEEREEILLFLQHQLARFDDLEGKCERQISLLKERRTALISAAVTGKIDVRNWQAPTHQGQALEQTA